MKVFKKERIKIFFIYLENFKKLLPDEYLSRYLSQNLRPDGRTLLDMRKIKIIMSHFSIHSLLYLY